MSDIHEGRCLCGELSYSVTGEPARVIVCHCRFCQRATGSTGMVDAIFPEATFVQRTGTPLVHRHLSQGSGKEVRVHFCGRCGGRTHLTFDAIPGVVGIYAGTFDDPHWFDRSGAPHIFADEAPPGTFFPADTDIFPKGLRESDGSPATAQRYAAPVRS
ncbi:GFA family protein [Mesobaculum littorinae]|uniref:GFA family protein n=1 Tax=Mesobaculum littorinae TaxID=2486419 RepID=A0A438AJQ9_9RHOB|nr:GFA family protein [Mesobaculum littorinae]RVV98876.1 GFA family protein [Mesobaculum littorinae]